MTELELRELYVGGVYLSLGGAMNKERGVWFSHVKYRE